MEGQNGWGFHRQTRSARFIEQKNCPFDKKVGEKERYGLGFRRTHSQDSVELSVRGGEKGKGMMIQEKN